MGQGNRTKDFLTDRDISRITREALDEGRTKQDVYEELCQRHDSKEYLAQVIARVPEVEARAKCKIANSILAALMNFVCSVNVVLPLLYMVNGTVYRWRVVDPLMGLLLLLLTFDVYRMNSYKIYTPVALLRLIGVLQATKLFSVQALWGVANVLLFGAISILSLHIGGCLRSDWAPMAPTKDG
jgi:hypothetical protein